MDFKKTFEKFEDQGSFIKTTTPPAPVEGTQKAALNRKGNQMFNDGDIESARRIFMTTGYSDGLARVGDHYKSQKRMLEALKMYWIAPDRKKSEPIIEQLAYLLQDIMHEGEPRTQYQDEAGTDETGTDTEAATDAGEQNNE
jgi:hypothetical protein